MKIILETQQSYVHSSVTSILKWGYRINFVILYEEKNDIRLKGIVWVKILNFEIFTYTIPFNLMSFIW